MPKNDLKKKSLLGVLIFLATEVILYSYSIFLINILPPGSVITPQKELLLIALRIVSWICNPFSHIFLLFGKKIITNFEYAWVLLHGINLLGWIALSILILRRKKDKKVQ